MYVVSKVTQSAERPSNDNGDDGGDNGVKFQTKWVPAKGTVPQFLWHLHGIIDAYLPYIYKVKLPNPVDTYAEQAFIILCVAHVDYPDEFKDVVFEAVDFEIDIHTN